MSRTAASPSTSPQSPPPLSVASSPVLPRRVQHRRGSSSAADPWGNHMELNMNPGRTTSCKLTIVRVNPTLPLQLDDQPPSPQHRRQHGFGAHSQNPYRRHSASKNENTRMSFASASFAPPASSGPGPRPGSPTHGHGHGLHRQPKPRLSADQLVSLAQQACNPQSAPTSPRGSLAASAGPRRASFTAIPDDVFLPFVDRADEVKALFTSPQPGARLLALLAQTFPPQSALDAPVTDEGVFGTDPRQWSSAQLEYWMKQVDRDIASDEVWVGLIRRCILYHSELIWERIKGALGAPPELDPDGFEVDPFTFDGPVTFKDLKLDPAPDLTVTHTEAPPNLVSELQPIPDHVSESNTSASVGDSPLVSALALFIEPVLMTTSPEVEHDHPPTRPGGQRMHDISEDVGEEGSSENEGEPAGPAPSPPREIIHGLRISTGPASPGLFATEIGPGHPLLRAMSMSAITKQQPIQVPDEHSSPPTRRNSVGSFRRRWSHGTSNASSEVYDVVGERGPGNPLFPTNFARLALGPTLTANNPALRSRNPPPAPAFSNPHAIRAGVLRGRRDKPSWAEGWDPMKDEYAITASESSVGGH
ncbi:hypothetical protein F5148DRAFT_1287426 [Russula earlei]|uniref:Uncharacterized protein n=1 Tax=Russula earlei TaxID=71964 RepID=A0ACC0U2P3_9AGAM|nr:hypothetical protein F5148DRAFT_1287426 [Russula earlei]